jgi:hypothetical protein
MTYAVRQEPGVAAEPKQSTGIAASMGARRRSQASTMLLSRLQFAIARQSSGLRVEHAESGG